MYSDPPRETGASDPYGICAPAVWREHHKLVRGAVPAEYCARFNLSKINSLVSRLPHMRVFVSDDTMLGGSPPSSRLVPRDDAPIVFPHLLRSSLRYTLLFNQVETVDDDVRLVRDHMRVPHRWREDDIVVTFSTIGSGIGYHAGHEDGIIVQTAGRRRWRVWRAETVDGATRKRILINADGDEFTLPISDDRPVVECELSPGDALYIPPFCPHEGITTDESISVALGWRGIAFFHMVVAFSDLIMTPGGLPSEALPSPFFELVPDHDFARDDPMDLSALVVTRLEELGCSIANCDLLALRLQTLFGKRSGRIPKDYAVA